MRHLSDGRQRRRRGWRRRRRWRWRRWRGKGRRPLALPHGRAADGLWAGAGARLFVDGCDRVEAAARGWKDVDVRAVRVQVAVFDAQVGQRGEDGIVESEKDGDGRDQRPGGRAARLPNVVIVEDCRGRGGKPWQNRGWQIRCGRREGVVAHRGARGEWLAVCEESERGSVDGNRCVKGGVPNDIVDATYGCHLRAGEMRNRCLALFGGCQHAKDVKRAAPAVERWVWRRCWDGRGRRRRWRRCGRRRDWRRRAWRWRRRWGRAWLDVVETDALALIDRQVVKGWRPYGFVSGRVARIDGDVVSRRPGWKVRWCWLALRQQGRTRRVRLQRQAPRGKVDRAHDEICVKVAEIWVHCELNAPAVG